MFAGTLREYRQVLETYFSRLGTTLVEIPHENESVIATTCHATVDDQAVHL
ncbi:MAG: hypothetical protein U0996_04175 [Planctomycetaceae bacterium]